MTKALVLGAGKIGVIVAELLSEAGDYAVTLADGDEAAMGARPLDGVTRLVLDVADAGALGRALDPSQRCDRRRGGER